MNARRRSALEWSAWFQRFSPVGRFLLALGSASLAAFLLFSPTIMTALATPITAMGLDPLRTQLVSALLLTAGAALVSALLNRHRLGVVIGAGSVYAISYVLPFISQEQRPVYDPGGHLEALNAGALEHTVAVLLAGGLLCAFLGAAIGGALGEVLLDPIWQLAQLIWQTCIHPNRARKQRDLLTDDEARKRGRWRLYRAWVGFFVMLGLFLLSTGLGNLLLFAPDLALHNPPTTNAHGTLLPESMASPAFHGQHRSFLIYLPPSYYNPADQQRRYPTLYLLHGSPGSEYDWSRGGKAVQSANTLIAQRETSELIMVFPDGNGRGGETSEWGNSFDQKQLMENFVALDLVHYIDQHYRTIPEASSRAIGGLSMGGFGAMNIAVHHPDIFGLVISLGGYYKAEGAIWGKNTAYIQANSPALVLPKDPQAWKLRIFLGAATKDQPYYTDALQFIRELKASHIAYTFDLENGYHAWNIWEIQLYHALIWLPWR